MGPVAPDIFVTQIGLKWQPNCEVTGLDIISQVGHKWKPKSEVIMEKGIEFGCKRADTLPWPTGLTHVYISLWG